MFVIYSIGKFIKDIEHMFNDNPLSLCRVIILTFADIYKNFTLFVSKFVLRLCYVKHGQD
jgi:hypothetical protein